MRVASSTGSAINSDSDILRDIRAALRDSKDLTVIQAIQNDSRQSLALLQELVRQGAAAGRGGTAGGPPGGSPHVPLPGSGGAGDPLSGLLLEFKNIASNFERIMLAFDGSGRGGGSPSNNLYNRQTELSMFREIDRLTKQIMSGTADLPGSIRTFAMLLNTQANNSIKGFISGMLSLGVHALNLTEQFGRLREKLSETIAGYRTDVLGSNALGTQEYFLEFFNRLKGGILTTSDSFRTVLKTAGDAVQSGLMSPLAATGQAIPELAQSFVRARQDIQKNFGNNLLSRGTAAQTEKWLTDMLDTLQNYGVKANVNSAITEERTNTMVSHLARISANTGISIDKLEALVKAAADTNIELVATGRLDATEAGNRNTFMGSLEGNFGKKLADPMLQVLTKALSLSRPEQGIGGLMVDPNFVKMNAAAPGLDAIIQRLNQGSIQGQTYEQMKPLFQQILQVTQDYQRMGRENPTAQNQVYGDIRGEMSALITMAQRVINKGEMTDEQKAREAEDPTATMINTALTRWEEMVKPIFGGLDGVITANIAALVANTAALLMFGLKAGAIGSIASTAAEGGMLARGAGVLGRAARFGGPLLAGAGGAFAAYEEGAPTGGIVGAGLGGFAGGALGGAALGSIVGPVGTAIGAIVGGVIGSYLGQKAGTAIQGEGPPGMAGPSPATMADQTQSNADASTTVLGQILAANTEAVGWLAQIKGELGRQTQYLTGTPSPAGAPAVGMGLTATSVPAGASLGRPNPGTAYDGT